MRSGERASRTSVNRPPLSVIVTTFNEEANLRGCLESVRFAEDVLVVDSFSTDATLDIAREFEARVLQHEYGYPAQQKNWAIPQAAHEWILLLDADERITPELRDEILAVLGSEPHADGYWIRRANHFLGRRIRRCGWGSDKVIRLFRRDVARYQDRRVHEEIELPEPLPCLRHPMEHHTFRSFARYWRRLQLYSEWGARQMYMEGRRAGALQIFARPAARFVRMYVLRLGFLEGVHGIVLSMLGAFTVYLKYARLWEMSVLGEAGDVAEGAGAGKEVGRGGRVCSDSAGTRTRPPGRCP